MSVKREKKNKVKEAKLRSHTNPQIMLGMCFTKAEVRSGKVGQSKAAEVQELLCPALPCWDTCATQASAGLRVMGCVLETDYCRISNSDILKC